MEVIAQYNGGVSFEVQARGHRVICDQPATNGGDDAGITPPEFLLASLATCAGFYAAQYLRTRGLSADDLRVRVVAEKALKPARLSLFKVEISMPALAPEHEDGVLRAAKACLIHHTLLGSPEIAVELQVGTPV